METWTLLVQNRVSAATKDNGENLRGELKSLISTGLKMTEAFRQMGKTFSTTLFLDMSSVFVAQIFTLFFLFTAYNLVLNFNVQYLLFVTMMGSIQVALTLRFWFMFSRGSALKEANQDAKVNLQRLRMLTSKDFKLDETTEYQLNLLEKRLSENQVLRPKGAFSLDYSSAVTSIGLMMTYMLVLFQFKIAEP